MGSFNKHELELFKSDSRCPYHEVVFLHVPTGLSIACNTDPCVTDEEVWVVQPPGTTLPVIKHVWVKAWHTGEDIRYQVGRLEDLPLLLEVVNSTRVQDVGFGSTDEFIFEALVKV